MPTNHRGKQRIPLDLEPALLDHLVAASTKLGIKRTVLARIFIKYGLNHLDDAIEFGDKIAWKPKDISIPLLEKPNAAPPGNNPNNKGST